MGFSWARQVGPSAGFGLGFQGRLGWAWVEFGSGKKVWAGFLGPGFGFEFWFSFSISTSISYFYF